MDRSVGVRASLPTLVAQEARSFVGHLGAIADKINAKRAPYRKINKLPSYEKEKSQAPSALFKVPFDEGDGHVRLVEIAVALYQVAPPGSEYAVLFEWMKELKQEDPSVLDLLVVPIHADDPENRVSLPWGDAVATSSSPSAMEVVGGKDAFVPRALAAMDFMRSQGCGFIVDLVLSSWWYYTNIAFQSAYRNKRKVTILKTNITSSSTRITSVDSFDYIGGRYYGVPVPVRDGVPALLTSEAFDWARLQVPSASADAADSAYLFVLTYFFGLEMPFLSVPAEDGAAKDRVASLLGFSDGYELATVLLSDPITKYAFPQADDRRMYVATNLLYGAYGPHASQSFFRTLKDTRRLTTTSGTVSQVKLRWAAHLWHIALASAANGDLSVLDEIAAVLGNHPTEREVSDALGMLAPGDRAAAVKALLRYGINVAHNEYGDIDVASRLLVRGIKPSAAVIAKWPQPTQQWYVDNVVLSQMSSVSEEVDRLFEPH